MKQNNDFSIQIEEIEEVYNLNIEVGVILPDGFPLAITVGTPQNLTYLME